jgi:hypothetical protein
MRPSVTQKERMDDFCSVASWQSQVFSIDCRELSVPYPNVRPIKRASERTSPKAKENRCAHAKSLVPALRSWNTLRCVGPNQSIVLDKFKCPAHGTEDTSRRDELEKAFRNLRDCLRHGNHMPGAHRRTGHPASKCSQRTAHEKQPSSAQYPHWGRSWRRCRSWDWCSDIQPMLFPKLLYSARW